MNQLLYAVRSVSAEPVTTTAPPIVGAVLRSGGEALRAADRNFMESRFGQDFSHVRVHTNARAADSATAVNARAYTVGRDIVFGPGEYAPESESGRRVLAHELTHVVQQGADNTGGPIELGSPGDPREMQAEQRAHSVLTANGETDVLARTPGSTHPVLRRLGANPGCSAAEATTIHQAIFNARGWVNKAIALMETSPLPAKAIASLKTNFGPTYGVPSDAALITGRLKQAYAEMSTIPIGCTGVAAPECAALHCGFATAGSHKATICTNVTLAPGIDWRAHAGCVLHESFHAAFSKFTVDEYSGWHGVSGSTPTYPGAGTDPLLNADSYTALVMDLS
jgi:hypothetical protein